jgi:hypothetical protein
VVPRSSWRESVEIRGQRIVSLGQLVLSAPQQLFRGGQRLLHLLGRLGHLIEPCVCLHDLAQRVQTRTAECFQFFVGGAPGWFFLKGFHGRSDRRQNRVECWPGVPRGEHLQVTRPKQHATLALADTDVTDLAVLNFAIQRPHADAERVRGLLPVE